MLHKRLMTPVLERMDTQKSAYFNDVSDALVEDTRIERTANLVFLLLAHAAPYLPTELSKHELVGRLIVFVDRNQHRLMRTAFDPAFLSQKDLIMPVVGEFVAEITAVVLKKYDDGKLDEKGDKVFHLSWPIDPDAFPYEDLDEEDDEED